MDFFDNVRDMLLHTQRVTRQEAARYDLSIAGVVEEITPPVEDLFSLMESFSGFRGGFVFPTGNGWSNIVAILKIEY